MTVMGAFLMGVWIGAVLISLVWSIAAALSKDDDSDEFVRTEWR